MRPKLSDQRLVVCPIKVGGCQKKKEWSSIDGTVVLPKRHLSQPGHFTLADLVYDLAWLRFALSVCGSGLSPGQKTKHPICDLRFHPERLEGGYDSIPSEYRAVPGNSRVRIQTLAGLIRQHQEIGFRSIHPVVKLFVVSGNTMIHLPDRILPRRPSWSHLEKPGSNQARSSSLGLTLEYRPAPARYPPWNTGPSLSAIEVKRTVIKSWRVFFWSNHPEKVLTC